MLDNKIRDIQSMCLYELKINILWKIVFKQQTTENIWEQSELLSIDDEGSLENI